MPINNTYLPHLIIKNGNIWAFELLKDKYEDIFFNDDNNKTCFHYLKSERNYDKVEFKDLEEIIKFFGIKEKPILKVIEIFVEQNKDIGIDEELIKFLLESPILKNIYFDYNEDYNTMFHIIANMRINKKSLSLIMKKLEELKEKDIDSFKNILNLQNIHGDSFLMIFLKNRNYMTAIEVLEKFYDYIQINSHNYLGNSLLHILFMDKYFEKVSNDIYNLDKIYELILKILKKNKKLILSKNREFNTPFILAANSGCNMALTIMTEIYDIKYLEQINGFSTVLHQACISNNLNTVRYLIESHHYDPNIQLKKRGNESLYGLAEGSTPLHAATVVSSIEIFEYLILHGGDPFIQNNLGNDAFDTAFELGQKSFLKYIINLKSSLRYGGNDKYLLSLVKNTNKDSIQFLYQYEEMNTFENFKILDKNMNTLLNLACMANNPEIIPTLLNIGLNPFAKNIDGFNCLHICAYLNSYCCAGIILSKFEGLEEQEKIKDILTTKNNDDETPLHIAIEKNYEDISLLFISYLLRNNIKLEMVKNSNGLTPLQLAIKNHSYKIALMYIKYLNLEYSEIMKIKNTFIEKIFDDFIFCYDSGLFKDDEKKIEEKFSNIDFYKLEKESFHENFKSRFEGENAIFKNINYNEINGGIKYKSYEFIKFNLEIYQSAKYFKEELFYAHKNILTNINVIFSLFRWGKNSKGDLIDSFLGILQQSNISNNKFEIDNSSQKDNEFYNIIEIISTTCLPFIKENEVRQYLEFLEQLMITIGIQNINRNNGFLKFIKNCIISYNDSPFSKPDLTSFIKEMNSLKYLILNDEEFIKYFNYTSSAFITYEMLFKINKILNIIGDRDFKLCQIQNLNKIPCLLDNEIQKKLNEYYILYDSVSSENELNYPLTILDKNIKETNTNIIKDILNIIEKVRENHEIKVKFKIQILDKIIYIYFNYINDKIINIKDFPSFLFNFFLLSKQILLKDGIDEYDNIIEQINQDKSFAEIIPSLYINVSNREINLNVEKEIYPILDKINLEEEDKKNIENIANLIQKYCKKYESCKYFKNIGKKIGENFKKSPNLKNLSKLITIIYIGVVSIMNMHPYLIQCISISLFLLHYLDIYKNKNLNYKGRLAQIKTGEGKSLIIAMLSLANALMGNFVDVITSTHYLAERDQLKFKKLYDEFGVSSSNITKSKPSKLDYNGIILYGTNTDFEFSLLFEGIYKYRKMVTVPLNSEDGSSIERTYDVAIVDECDNLFLDTAKNSARISHPSKYHYNWIYPIIYDYFNKNENNLDIKELRDKLLNYEEYKYSKDLERISDKRLKEYLDNAKIARNKTLNRDYIIGYDEKNKSKQIKIVDSNTGRIQHGSRWSDGIHEFVEVKEGIEPKTENNIIGSISHPTYFENYKILFGLTGTIGEEIERKELNKIYKVKSYDVPRKSKELLIQEKMEIYKTKDLKYNRILDIIKENNENKKQPILIILENIRETLDFGNKLKKLNYEFYTLNDVQKESEEYILDNSGHCGRILLATNAAGRGTDIIIDDLSKERGGLYVIIGFFPQNSRIEYQAIGRAGRQGNPGRSKIIVSEDEEFIFLSKNKKDEESLYKFRKLSVEQISKNRIDFFEKEKIYYYILKQYFLFKDFMICLFDNTTFNYCFDCLYDIEENINYEFYKKFTLSKIDDIWSEFYSDLVKDRNKEGKLDINKNYFISFMEKVQNEWPNCLKEVYIENYENNLKSDIIAKIMKTLKNEIYMKNNILNDAYNDYNCLKELLSKIKFEDLFK